ncbi:hypothetical protein [Vacuolonema iberomarrocanum]|uniref:hypothetical protein n=1 Tax=Vacuolonema iberomarrocanum TaxID=3454632 RepID=UPI0019F8C90C|nr:hypothetical protein [filamentous cyanobacterium LEGE 07170]
MQFLAIARPNEGTSPTEVLPYGKPEAEKGWVYYTDDISCSVHYIADMSGAVLMLEADSLEVARSLVAALPDGSAQPPEF